MRTMSIQVYKLNELSEHVQAKVIERLRLFNVEYFAWYDCEIDSWKEELETLGFIDADIRFSGFGSQGDGASFTAEIDLDYWLKGKYETLKQYDIEYNLNRNDFLYSHEHSVEVSMNYCLELEKIQGFKELVQSLESEIDHSRMNLCCRIYRDLESYYDSLICDAYVAECLINNDHEFLENGDDAPF